MERAVVAIVASALVLLGGSCSLPEGQSDRPDQPPSPEDRVVTIERTLPCKAVAPVAARLIGKVDSSVAREPGEKFAPLPDARKVAEATYFCGWSNAEADAVLRIYPDAVSAEQAQRVWEGRTGQTSAYGGNQCTQAPSGFGDGSMGVVCALGTQRAVFQVLGLFGDSLVECWHTRANSDPATVGRQGMAFCRQAVEAIGVTREAS